MRRKIDVFGKWLKTYNPESDDDPRHVDAGTLFTRYIRQISGMKFNFWCTRAAL